MEASSKKIGIRDIAIFGMFSALMFTSKVIMEALPNIHLIGVFVVVITLVYRKYALYPIYGFVFISGLFYGFPSWWFSYLYIWAILWGAVMLLPKKMPRRVAPFVYMGVLALHGLLYGTLYTPIQVLFFGLDLKAIPVWILSGLWFDLIHGVSNFFCGGLVVPLVMVLKRASKRKI